MSTLQQRLAGVTDTIAHLNAQIRRMGNSDLPWVISPYGGNTRAPPTRRIAFVTARLWTVRERGPNPAPAI
jgi:hypothetical protein